MDKTIEVIVVFMIALVTAIIVLFLVQGEREGFGNFLDSQTESAECQVKYNEYRQQTVCEEGDIQPQGGSGGIEPESLVDMEDLDCDTSNWPERRC
jgi:hypothetical protein